MGPAPCRALVFVPGSAGVSCWRRSPIVAVAHIEPGEEWVVDRFTIDELDHHIGGLVAHLEGTLAYLGMAAPIAECLGLRGNVSPATMIRSFDFNRSITWSVT